MLRLSKKKILIILAERKMTVADFAASQGMRPNNLSALLNRGSCQPTTAGKLAETLGVSVVEIVED